MTGPLKAPILPALWAQNQNPNPNLNPGQTSNQPPSRLQTAVPSNPASSQPKSRLTTTSQQSNNAIEVIKWCLSHKKYYADRNLGTIGAFWIRCGQFIKEKFNKTYAVPERMVRSLENRRRQEIATGCASIARDDLKQALDKWIGFLDDTKRRTEERKAQSSQPSLGEQARDMLCRRMAEQREARTAAEQREARIAAQQSSQTAKRTRDAEEDQSDGDTTDSEDSMSPSERRRKKLRRMKEQERETELYTTALTNGLRNGLTNALTSFATTFITPLSKAMTEPIEEVKNELKELKTELKTLRSELRQMHEFNAEMKEKTNLIIHLLEEMREERLERKTNKVEE
ncbi:hypothetical protein CNMCM5793_008702 [Aspergillus hiratsukae]|uniref:Uncharacterized protein n=1 Tax=Aspergillus hiratsukae TaxID=1194566 RepID=A0A8H6P818_9EURO|nr:hypothetical protein CNMCM5793_008702 [Aspergillus hiratsukae]